MSNLISFVLVRVVPKLSTWQWWLLAVASLVISQLTMGWLNGLYLASQFPVSIYEGQTAFSGETIKGYYATLMDLGTFGKYVWVQIADYAFMLTVFISMLFTMIALYRLVPERSFLKPIAKAMIFIAPLSAVSDALENLVSFFMLANPENFANWIAVPYSTFAVTKFALFSLSYLWIGIAILAGISIYAFRLVRESAVAQRRATVK